MEITTARTTAEIWYSEFMKIIQHWDNLGKLNTLTKPFRWTKIEINCRDILSEAIDKAQNQKKSVLIISDKSRFYSLLSHFMSIQSGVKLSALHNVNLQQNDWANLDKAFRDKLDIPLFFCFTDDRNEKLELNEMRELNISAVYLL